MEVRLATVADAEAIERVRISGWQTAYRHVFPPEELDAMTVDWSRWASRLETPPAGWSTFVADRDGEVVGFAALGPSRDVLDIGELYAIYVRPDAWATGAGRALIARAEQALARDYDVAALWVLEENARARAFYERAGWELDGARKTEEWLGARVTEVRYRKRLR